MWEALRRNEQRIAADRARDLARKGDCEGALDSLDRAQGYANLGDFAAESTWLRARCLERLARHQEALAHWRLLEDFFPESPYAQRIDPSIRSDLGDSRPTGAWQTAPRALEIPEPRYSRTARRSHLIGGVAVRYRVGRDGEVDEIRVTESAHVLLSSWAIEAIAQAKWHSERAAGLELPRWAISNFRFEYHWAIPDGGNSAAASVE